MYIYDEWYISLSNNNKIFLLLSFSVDKLFYNSYKYICELINFSKLICWEQLCYIWIKTNYLLKYRNKK